MTLPPRRTFADREEVLGAVMLAPALAYVILLVGVPFVFAILLGFSNATAGSLSFGWAGLHNYRAILDDPIFLRALRNSVIVTVGSQVLVVILATAAAQVFRAAFHGKRFARFVLLLPWAVPVSLAAIAWTWIFDSTFSVINWTLKAVGLLHGWLYWLGEPGLALLAIIIVQAWRIFRFATVIVLAALSSIPQEVVGAACRGGCAGPTGRRPEGRDEARGARRRGARVHRVRRLRLLLDADHGVQAEPRPVRRRNGSESHPVDLQRPADARAREAAPMANRLPPLGAEHPRRGCGGGRHHRGGGRAGGGQPRPAGGTLGRASGHGDLLHLPHPPDPPVRAVLAARLAARRAEFPARPDPDLP